MKEQLLTTLENSLGYTMAVAEAMPDKDYQTKPVENVWNFGELLHHIAYGIEWWTDNYVVAHKTDWNPPALKNNKKAITQYLNKTYSGLRDVVNKATITDEIVKGFYATMDHITHHRGQAVLHLKGRSINPPEYRY